MAAFRRGGCSEHDVKVYKVGAISSLSLAACPLNSGFNRETFRIVILLTAISQKDHRNAI